MTLPKQIGTVYILHPASPFRAPSSSVHSQTSPATSFVSTRKNDLLFDGDGYRRNLPASSSRSMTPLRYTSLAASNADVTDLVERIAPIFAILAVSFASLHPVYA